MIKKAFYYTAHRLAIIATCAILLDLVIPLFDLFFNVKDFY